MKQLIVKMTEDSSHEDQLELQHAFQNLYFALTKTPVADDQIEVTRGSNHVTVVDEKTLTTVKEERSV